MHRNKKIEIKHGNINQMIIRMRRYETNMILKIKVKKILKCNTT